MKRNVIIWAVLLGLGIGQAIWAYPRLPDQVASHFGYNGQPDGWMSRGVFTGFGVGGVLTEGMGMATRLLGAQRKLPGPDGTPGQIDVLAPVSAFLSDLGILLAALILLVQQRTIQANLNPPPVLTGVWPLIVVFLGCVALLATRLTLHHRRLTAHLAKPALPAGVWFPAKAYGYGWGPPCCWQGWVATLIWLALFLGGMGLLIWRQQFVWLAPWGILMVTALIVLCAKKGEKLRWRWGPEKTAGGRQ